MEKVSEAILSDGATGGGRGSRRAAAGGRGVSAKIQRQGSKSVPNSTIGECATRGERTSGAGRENGVDWVKGDTRNHAQTRSGESLGGLTLALREGYS